MGERPSTSSVVNGAAVDLGIYQWQKFGKFSWCILLIPWFEICNLWTPSVRGKEQAEEFAKGKACAYYIFRNNICFFPKIIYTYISGQIIATSHDLTPNGGLVRDISDRWQNPGSDSWHACRTAGCLFLPVVLLGCGFSTNFLVLQAVSGQDSFKRVFIIWCKFANLKTLIWYQPVKLMEVKRSMTPF